LIKKAIYRVLWLVPPALCLVGLSIPPSMANFRKSTLVIHSLENKKLGKGVNEKGNIREWKNLSEFPEYLPKLVLLAEDKRFYDHPGIDVIALGNSFVRGTFRNENFRGASTITQQLVRILFPEIKNQPTFVRKAIESILSIRYSMWIPKTKILEVYLNSVSIHSNYEGFPAASNRYFRKDIRFISIPETIALTVLIRSNAQSSDVFRKRCNWLKNKFDPSIEMDFDYLEKSLELLEKPKPERSDFLSENLHFEKWIRTMYPEMKGVLNSHFSSNTNFHVYKIVLSELEILNKFNVSNASVLVLKMPEGKEPMKLISMIGSKNFFEEESGQINGSMAYRDAGSTLKPLLYGLGIEKKILYPYTIFHDVEKSFMLEGSKGVFNPRNADLQFWGEMTLAEALSNSRNIPAVEALEKISVPDFFTFLRGIGWNQLNRSPDNYGLGLALGTGGATLLQLTYAYSIFPAKGKMIPLELGRVDKIPATFGSNKIIFSKETAEEVSAILSDAKLRKRAFGNRSFLDFPFPVSVKTGTSKDYRNSWTVGFTEKYVVGVWVGNFSGERTLEVTGSFGAGRIFHSVMRYLMENETQKNMDLVSLKAINVCRKTGKLAGKFCPMISLRVRKSFNEKSVCNHHKNFDESVRIISPLDGQIFISQPEIPKTKQSIPIRLKINSSDNITLVWNEKENLKVSPDGESRIPSIPGEHFLSLFHGRDEVQKVKLTIR